jgi:P-type Cu2+ transporter
VTKGPQHNSDAKMPAHHDGNHPHHRPDAPTASHHHHNHQQPSGQPVTTGRTTAAHAHQHDVHAGHDKHAGHSVEMFRQKFWGTLLLSVPTIVWAPMIQQWFGYEAPGGRVTSRWIPALFGSLVFGYGGWVFIRGAEGEIVGRRPGMMTLIALAITVAFAFSVAVTLGFPGMDLWWELATLVTIMVLGHWVEMRSIS